MKKGGETNRNVADQNLRDSSQSLSSEIKGSAIRKNEDLDATQIYDNCANSASQSQRAPTLKVLPPAVPPIESLRIELFGPNCSGTHASTSCSPQRRHTADVLGKEKPLGKAKSAKQSQREDTPAPKEKADANAFTTKQASLINTLYQCIALLVNHSLEIQQETLFSEFEFLESRTINNLLNKGSDEEMDALGTILSAADLKSVVVLRVLFEEYSVQVFAAAIRKHLKMNGVDEGMIRRLKTLLQRSRSPTIFGPEEFGPLSLLVLRMKYVLNKAAQQRPYFYYRLSEKHKANLRKHTVNFRLHQYVTYIDTVETREVKRQNEEWIKICRVREELKQTGMTAKQQFEELLDVFLEPGQKEVRGQCITVTLAMTLAFEHSLLSIDRDCPIAQQWITKSITSQSKNRKDLTEQEKRYVYDLTVQQRKQAPQRIRKSIVKWLAENRRQNSLSSEVKIEDTNTNLTLPVDDKQATATDASRVIRFSSVNLLSGEFNAQYKLFRQEEDCLLRVVAKAFEDSSAPEDESNSSAPPDFEAQLGSWSSQSGWTVAKGFLSVEVEGFEDFFIRQWGRRETLEANRGALLALFNYLLNIVSKFESQKDIVEEIRRLHSKEGSGQSPKGDAGTAGQLSAELHPNFNPSSISFALSVLCCAVVTRPSIIPLNLKKFLTIYMCQHQRFQSYYGLKLLKRLKDFVAQQYHEQVRLCLKQLKEILFETQRKSKTKEGLVRIVNLIGKQPLKSALLKTPRVLEFMAPWLLKNQQTKGSMDLYIAEIKRWHIDKLLATIREAGKQTNRGLGRATINRESQGVRCSSNPNAQGFAADWQSRL